MTTTLDLQGLKDEVAAAIKTLSAHFEPSDVVIEPDGLGGARFRLGPTPLSAAYEQSTTWVGAHVPPLIPYADVYPIFIRGDLRRQDGAALVAPITPGHTFMGQTAVQVSRRSNRRDASVETVLLKVLKVLDWVNSQ